MSTPRPDLPAGCLASSAGPEHAEEVVRLVAACDAAAGIPAEYGVDEARDDLGPLADGSSRDQLLIRDAAGELVSWWWTDPRPGQPRYLADVYLAPALRESVGVAIAAAAFSALDEWAAAWLAAGAIEGGYLSLGSVDTDAAYNRRLAAGGFQQVRTFAQLSAPADPAGSCDVAPPDNPAVRVRTAAGESAQAEVYALWQGSFADHWGHQPADREDWLTRERSLTGYDPTLWWVADLDGVPAGFLIASRVNADAGALYVHLLGTLSQCRGHGVATALLRRAFAAARQEAYPLVQLGVDTQSPTGADRLYEQVGFRRRYAFLAWERPVGPG